MNDIEGRATAYISCALCIESWLPEFLIGQQREVVNQSQTFRHIKSPMMSFLSNISISISVFSTVFKFFLLYADPCIGKATKIIRISIDLRFFGKT